MFAHPRPAITASSTEAAVAAAAQLASAEAVDEIVVGLPLTMAGGESDQTRSARAFARALRARVPVPVTPWDERLSSQQAARAGAGQGKRRDGSLDSAAAAVVLQAVLDSRRGTAT